MPPGPRLPVQVDRNRYGGVAPLLELVPGAVLLVDQPSRERLLRLALDDARPPGESPPADLDVHGGIGAQIAHPVGVLTAAGEEIDAVAPIVGGREPDLDAMRPPGTTPRGRQVAVLRRAPDHR